MLVRPSVVVVAVTCRRGTSTMAYSRLSMVLTSKYIPESKREHTDVELVHEEDSES